MSGVWRECSNHDLGDVYDTTYSTYPKDYIKGIYLIANPELLNPVWYLKFESGWKIGMFDSVEEAIQYTLRNYREHIRMV